MSENDESKLVNNKIWQLINEKKSEFEEIINADYNKKLGEIEKSAPRKKIFYY